MSTIDEAMRRHVEALTSGFTERIEFSVTVNGMQEKRRVVRRFDGLLPQLEANSTTPLQSRAQGGGSNPNKSGSRPPLNQAYADLVDSIHEEAIDAWEVLQGAERPSWALPVLLRQLQHSVAFHCQARPHVCGQVESAASGWVRRARVSLGFETRMVQLTESVCGKCGGALVVAADASTDVRCVGNYNDGCGMVYGRTQWLSLALNVW